MKKQTIISKSSIILSLALILAAISTVTLSAAGMGVSSGHDLDALKAAAEKNFDLSKNDAVLLLESKRIDISKDGRSAVKVHRVVWINTPIGIRTHADLRIPYNSSLSEMKVTKLRTWRDGKWWPHESEVSETAVVETLPFAVAQADDYTAMRETMLLHDGVELPCVMETEYVIEDKEAAEGGHDGFWIFKKDEPAVLVEYKVSAPKDAGLKFYSGNGTPKPEASTGPDGVTYTWTMENIDRIGSPQLSSPRDYAPFVSWSTWSGWQPLGAHMMTRFDAAASLDEGLADTVASRTGYSQNSACAARKVTGLVEESTRSIHYDYNFWGLSPRSAMRTWGTAYGHGMDRAVLAAAMFREAGLDAGPVFFSTGSSAVPVSPGLSCFDGFGLIVEGDMFKAFYDPASGGLDEGLASLHGRVIWEPADGGAPFVMGHDLSEETSIFKLSITLEPDGEGWNGKGYLKADGILCPYGDMAGPGGSALSFLKEVAGSVIDGADVTAFNPEVFDRAIVSAVFDFRVKEKSPDEYGRISLVIGDPSAGVLSGLPDDIHTYMQHRSSPVRLPAKMNQVISVRLKTGERKLLRLPDKRVVENEAGVFSVEVVNGGGWVTVKRNLMLGTVSLEPEQWPMLRELLLEESDPANRTIYMK